MIMEGDRHHCYMWWCMTFGMLLMERENQLDLSDYQSELWDQVVVPPYCTDLESNDKLFHPHRYLYPRYVHFCKCIHRSRINLKK